MAAAAIHNRRPAWDTTLTNHDRFKLTQAEQVMGSGCWVADRICHLHPQRLCIQFNQTRPTLPACRRFASRCGRAATACAPPLVGPAQAMQMWRRRTTRCWRWTRC